MGSPAPHSPDRTQAPAFLKVTGLRPARGKHPRDGTRRAGRPGRAGRADGFSGEEGRSGEGRVRWDGDGSVT